MHRRRSPLPVRYPWQIGWFSNQGAGKLRELLSSATMADQAGLKLSEGRKLCLLSSVTMADQAGLKRPPRCSRSPYGSVTMADQAGLKLFLRRIKSTRCSVTMADQAGLKPVGADTPSEQGLSISKNCKICQVFLFQRPARSFFDRALGSPQASIPALTAVWIHYSKFASECEFAKLGSP